MNSYIAAAGEQLENELRQEAGSIAGPIPDRHKRRCRLRALAQKIAEQTEGESAHDALTALYIAGEMVMASAVVTVEGPDA